MAGGPRDSKATRTRRSNEGRSPSASVRTWRCCVPTFTAGKAVTIWWGILSTVALFTLGEALAQTPGRYIQQKLEARIKGEWVLRVDSVDVLPDKSMRVNFIITNDDKKPRSLTIKDTSKIHLVSDSLERVSGVGKPEGQWAVSSYGAIEFAPDDSIKISFQFPAFQKETKTMNLIFYEGAVQDFWGIQIKNIALFTKQ